jgi:acyl-CoA thioester hydrolase
MMQHRYLLPLAPMPTEARFRVRYAETDQMGVVYHANYLVWMEMGRVELCRSRGIRYRDMEERDGVLLAVASASCRYRAPARYDDEVAVHTTITRSSTRLVEFGYRILLTETGKLLSTGSTTHLFCDREMRPSSLPEKYWAAFGVTA